jgi:hypothetical protein
VSGDHPAEPSCQGKTPPTGKEALNREQAFNVFKLYEDKGWAVKQQMLTSVGWLTPGVFALIAYCFTQPAPWQAAWTAFFLSCFMLALIVLSLKHANDDYARSHAVIKYVRDNRLFPDDIFNVILGDKERESEKVWLRYIGPQFHAMIWFAVVLVLISLGVALWATGVALWATFGGAARSTASLSCSCPE